MVAAVQLILDEDYWRRRAMARWKNCEVKGVGCRQRLPVRQHHTTILPKPLKSPRPPHTRGRGEGLTAARRP